MLKTPTLIAATLLLVTSPAVAAGETFCERMAPQVEMKPHNDKEWKVNLLGGMWTTLVGGSALVSFSVRPVDETRVDEYKRLGDACHGAAQGVLCKIDGPANVGIKTPRGQIAMELAADESTELEMRNSVMYCRNK